MPVIRIATRKSKLALWQTNYVAKLLQNQYSDLEVRIVGRTTSGDKIQNTSLSEIGGKGLFIKELEEAMLCNEADIAVHSLKDLPVKLDERFTLAAILPREDPGDAFISNKYTTLDLMPHGGIIGTSSIRRKAFLHKYYPHLQVKLLRGNVDTRLNKLDNDEYDGIILAVAGIKRLGLESRIKEYLAIDKFVPSIAQGVIAIEVLKSNPDISKIISVLSHKDTILAVTIEREVGRSLGASCNLPFAVYAEVRANKAEVQAVVMNENAEDYYVANIEGDAEYPLDIAKSCVKKLLTLGAQKVLDKYK